MKKKTNGKVVREELSEESLGQVSGGALADIDLSCDIGGGDLDSSREIRLLMESLVNNDSSNSHSINGL